jgi:hypothetical protein
MQIRLALVIACLAVVPRLASAEVVDRGANGFTVRSEVTLATNSDAVYATLLRVEDWWDPEHTWSGNASNLRLDPRAGGCFCETLTNGGSVEHAVVVYAAPGQMLRMRGSLGPLQATGLAGSLTWQLEPRGGGTKLTVTYAVGGYFPGGADALANPVDQVMARQLARLKALVERSN